AEPQAAQPADDRAHPAHAAAAPADSQPADVGAAPHAGAGHASRGAPAASATRRARGTDASAQGAPPGCGAPGGGGDAVPAFPGNLAAGEALLAAAAGSA